MQRKIFFVRFRRFRTKDLEARIVFQPANEIGGRRSAGSGQQTPRFLFDDDDALALPRRRVDELFRLLEGRMILAEDGHLLHDAM